MYQYAAGYKDTKKKVDCKLAMTGEITLRGKVLPIGGLKEKLLAAKTAGIKKVLVPEENRKDVEEIKAEYVEGLEFHYVKMIDQGSSELNIIIGVDNRDFAEAIRVLYNSFVM